MSLINCANCGKSVSDKAVMCPYCGGAVNLSEEKKYSTNIANSIIAYFDKNEYGYELDEEAGIISAGFPIVKGKLGKLSTEIIIGKTGYTSRSMIEMKADEESMPLVSEYLTRANYGLRNGNFEFDFRDGEIAYKVHLNNGDFELNESQIIDSYLMANIMFGRYGDGLIQVMFGIKTPEEAIEEAEAEKD